MKRIVYAALATISAIVLLFSYRTSHVDQTTASSDAGTSTSDSGTGTTTGGAAGSSAGTTGASGTATGTAASATGLTDGSYTGAAAQTRYGAVQVQITVTDGRISDVQVPAYPDGNPKDRQINARAVPQLVSETTAAQSANIDMVSGATFTSDGYLTSLQSAIDQAKA